MSDLCLFSFVVNFFPVLSSPLFWGHETHLLNELLEAALFAFLMWIYNPCVNNFCVWCELSLKYIQFSWLHLLKSSSFPCTTILFCIAASVVNKILMYTYTCVNLYCISLVCLIYSCTITPLYAITVLL